MGVTDKRSLRLTKKERRENSPSRFVPVQARMKVDFLELEAMPNPRGWEQEGPQRQQTSGQGNKSDKWAQRSWEKAARKVSSAETLGKNGKYSCWHGSPVSSHSPQKPQILPGSWRIYTSTLLVKHGLASQSIPACILWSQAGVKLGGGAIWVRLGH